MPRIPGVLKLPKKLKRKPMNFQTSLDLAGRLGARLKKLEKKDLPR